MMTFNVISLNYMIIELMIYNYTSKRKKNNQSDLIMVFSLSQESLFNF